MSFVSPTTRFDLSRSRWKRFGVISILASTLLMLLPGGTVICIDSCGAWEITVAHEAHTCGHSSPPASPTAPNGHSKSSGCHHRHHHTDDVGQHSAGNHRDIPSPTSEVEWDTEGSHHHSPCRDFESLDSPASLTGGFRPVVTTTETIYEDPTEVRSEILRFAKTSFPILQLKPGAHGTIPIPLRL